MGRAEVVLRGHWENNGNTVLVLALTGALLIKTQSHSLTWLPSRAPEPVPVGLNGGRQSLTWTQISTTDHWLQQILLHYRKTKSCYFAKHNFNPPEFVFDSYFCSWWLQWWFTQAGFIPATTLQILEYPTTLCYLWNYWIALVYPWPPDTTMRSVKACCVHAVGVQFSQHTYQLSSQFLSQKQDKIA